MRRCLPMVLLVLVAPMAVQAQGVLIPADRSLPPLSMTSHVVDVAIEDQVAVTKVTQVFHNPSDRALEATYIFPVPKGASVRQFTMWVDGKEVSGELIEAEQARGIYTDIVRRMQDPGLLEYVGNNLLQLRIYPVPARGAQKVAISYTSVADSDDGVVEYTYPMRAESKNPAEAGKCAIKVHLKSQHRLHNIYSPSHGINQELIDDHEASVTLASNAATDARDFQLYYSTDDKDVGLTLLASRPLASSDGHFMLLLSPRTELSRTQKVARDMVFVLDTSGSMAGAKMEQAKKALKFCLDQLDRDDRFCVMNFSTTVNQFSDQLIEAGSDQVERAHHWVEQLQATGGTAIDEALHAALGLRTHDSSRTFAVVFFTDGQPTVGETDPQKILKHVMAKNSANTRIFTFGVGDDVNAQFLDQLADQTRAVSSYVRPEEDIEVKVSNLYAKISHPVLTNLKLTAGKGASQSEIYPVHLPDMFHGSQVVVLGKYAGKGHTLLTLTGEVGHEKREFTYEVAFPEKTGNDKGFVEDLWARRKVGYLLEQIRANGQKKELVQEVVALAKKHGITTPFTSYLVVPDASRPLVTTASPPDWVRHYKNHGYQVEGGVAPRSAAAVGAAPMPRPVFSAGAEVDAPAAAPLVGNTPPIGTNDMNTVTHLTIYNGVDLLTGKSGVDLALQLNDLRNQNQVTAKAARVANGRNCLDINGVWIDEGFTRGQKTVTIKAQSDAYFDLLKVEPKMKEVLQLGNRVVWVTPSGTALVIDPTEGKDMISRDEIMELFASHAH